MRMPVSSPWAPAAGWSVTASIPLISARSCSSRQSSSRVPWAVSSGASGWSAAKPGQAGRPLVHLGVVLHGARAERIEARVNRPVEVREVDVVPDQGRLVELGQGRRDGPPRGLPGGARGRPPEPPGAACRRLARGARARTGWAGAGLPVTVIGRTRRNARPSSAARAAGEPLDLRRRGDLRGAHQEALGERRVARLQLGQRDAGQDAGAQQAAVDGDSVRDADGELVEVRARMEARRARRPRAPLRAPRPAPRRSPRRRGGRRARGPRCRSRRPARTAPGSCRCCWPPARAGCPARARAAS